MTVTEFFRKLEGYFGEKHSGVLHEAMSEYLAKATPDFLRACFRVLVKRCSRSFGKAPGIFEIEQNLSEIRSLIPKPVLLPEEPPKLSEEERRRGLKILQEFKESLAIRQGSMVPLMMKTVERIEKALDPEGRMA